VPEYPPIRSVASCSPRQNATIPSASGTGAANRARTVMSAVIITITGLVVASRSPMLIPDQPANTPGADAAAARVTGSPKP
jgi:hypothetical protein